MCWTGDMSRMTDFQRNLLFGELVPEGAPLKRYKELLKRTFISPMD